MDINARIDEANKIIETIASRGRRFFWSPTHDRISRFMVAGETIYLIDHYSGAVIDTSAKAWHGFTNGGTMRALIEALAHFIGTGEPVSRDHFGPWPTRSHGDLWGYGDSEMEKVRRAVFSSPAVDAPLSFLVEMDAVDQHTPFTALVLDEDGHESLAHVYGLDAEDAAGEAAERISRIGSRVGSLKRTDYADKEAYAEAVDEAATQAFLGTRKVEVWEGLEAKRPATPPVFTRDFEEPILSMAM